jgi:hypothetical protein
VIALLMKYVRPLEIDKFFPSKLKPYKANSYVYKGSLRPPPNDIEA